MADFYPCDGHKSTSFEQSVLLIPIVSIANVAQLAADLLLATLDFVLVGSLSAQNHVPVAGALESGQPGVMTAVQVFQSRNARFTLVMQRSPPLKSRKAAFVQDLTAFVQAAKFQDVVVLSGVDIASRPGPPAFDSLSHLLVGSPSLAEKAASVLPQYKTATPTEQTIPFLAASGIARSLLEAFAQKDIATLAILQYVAEGDNREDARVLASATSAVLLDQPIRDFKLPQSWAKGLYGDEIDQSIFG